MSGFMKTVLLFVSQVDDIKIKRNVSPFFFRDALLSSFSFSSFSALFCFVFF